MSKVAIIFTCDCGKTEEVISVTKPKCSHKKSNKNNGETKSKQEKR